jgi:deoxyribodipyrimidine photo-lyase
LKPYGLHWFRRDLRLEGNRGLEWNLKRHDGRVLGLFCFDRKFLAREDFSPDRFAFFLKTLAALRDEIRARGGDLLCLDVGPDDGFATLLQKLGPAHAPGAVSFNRDYEPFALDRDARISAWLEGRHGLLVHTERDHLLIEPSELRKPDPKSPYYQVFTPFKKKWLKLVAEDEFAARWHRDWKPARAKLTWPEVLAHASSARGTDIHDVLDRYLESSLRAATVPIPEAGHAAALRSLEAFAGGRLRHYDRARDLPAMPGTSQLSIFFKNGSLTVPETISRLELIGDRGPKAGQYLVELVWREFYYHLLAHFPRVETESFNRKYARLKWSDNEKWFGAWCEGRTGYPIVDAGMRQLNQTGWMHNRVRMIVASFLVKDLHLNWQWGERYFMRKLLDGDLAPNNGGWQWAASTGADPVPYFRVFNPTLQGKRFDRDGEYIRRWVPELAGLSRDEIHEPRDPIVDHATQKTKAIAMFKAAAKGVNR